MWCLVCTKWAPQLGSKHFSNFVKDAPKFQPPRRKKEGVDIHFKSVNHSCCSEKEKTTLISAKDAIIYNKLTTIEMRKIIKNVLPFEDCVLFCHERQTRK